MKYCTNCGAKLPLNALFCPSCGQPVGGVKKTQPNKIVDYADDEEDDINDFNPNIQPIRGDEIMTAGRLTGRSLLETHHYQGGGHRAAYTGNIKEELMNLGKKNKEEIE